MELEAGQVVVVTGGASGIGLGLAEAFAARGCSIVIADVDDDAMAAAADTVGGHGVETLTVHTDVSSADSVEALAAATVDRFGGVHVVCNNAGVNSIVDPWNGPIEAWEWTMGVNFWGVVHGIRAFLPRIVESGGGHVLNTASIAGLLPEFGASYSASKHAVVAVSENLLNHVRTMQLPVGVSCLCPGWVRTRLMHADEHWPEELGEQPESDAATKAVLDLYRRVLDEGTPPAVIADACLDAIESSRYWVLPHQDFLDLAVARFHLIAERQDPQPVDQMPGAPSPEQIMDAVMQAMTPDAP